MEKLKRYEINLKKCIHKKECGGCDKWSWVDIDAPNKELAKELALDKFLEMGCGKNNISDLQIYIRASNYRLEEWERK